MFDPCAENLNVLWSELIIEECVRQGIHQFYVSPGSRNSPLITAISRHKQIQSQLVYDERSAAFLALGYAKSQGLPAVLVCTSGSALFHYYPAVLEASQESIPMLILTADRPPELHDCGANQSIKQTNAFADFVRWHVSLPCPDLAVAPEFVLKTLDQACAYALREAGPVHINLPFREPLAPELKAIPESYVISLKTWCSSHEPHTQLSETFSTLMASSKQKLIQQLEKEQDGLLLVGRLNRPEDQEAVYHFARHLHWPVIADLLSGLRLRPDFDLLLKHQDMLLASPDYRLALNPGTILQIGSGFVSGPLLKHISSLKPKVFISLTSHLQRQDPHNQADIQLHGRIDALCHELVQQTAPQAGTRWSHDLYQASEKVSDVLNEYPFPFSNIAVIRTALQNMPEECLLFTGNSLTIRLIDTFAAGHLSKLKTFANRGLSGIDGNVSTAIGIAQAEQRPMLLCLGDISLLHDINALGLAAQVATPLVILLLNNHGGGIFHHLPIAQHKEIFEPWFGTPHDYSFRGAAEMFSLPYVQVQQLTDLKQHLEQAFQHQGATLIEAQSDRYTDHHQHQTLKKMTVKALDSVFHSV